MQGDPPKYRTFRVNNETVDIPTENADVFLKDYPAAKEYKSFIVEKDTIDIPIENTGAFLKDYPQAQSTYSDQITEGTPPERTGLDPLATTQPQTDITQIGTEPLVQSERATTGLSGITSPQITPVATPEMPMEQKLNIWREQIPKQQQAEKQKRADIFAKNYPDIQDWDFKKVNKEIDATQDPNSRIFLYEKALEKAATPEEQSSVRTKLAYNRILANDWDGAINDANNAIGLIESQPLPAGVITKSVPSAYQYRAYASLQKGDYEQALLDADKAAELEGKRRVDTEQSMQDENGLYSIAQSYQMAAEAASKIDSPQSEQAVQKYKTLGDMAQKAGDGIVSAKNEKVWNQWFTSGQFQEDLGKQAIYPWLYGEEMVSAGKEMVKAVGEDEYLKALNSALSAGFSATMAATPTGGWFQVANIASQQIQEETKIPTAVVMEKLGTPVTLVAKDIMGAKWVDENPDLANSLNTIGMIALFKSIHSSLGTKGKIQKAGEDVQKEIKFPEPTVQSMDEMRKVGEAVGKFVTKQDLTPEQAKIIETAVKEATPQDIKAAIEVVEKNKVEEVTPAQNEVAGTIFNKNYDKLTEAEKTTVDNKVAEAPKIETKAEEVPEEARGDIVDAVKSDEQVLPQNVTAEYLAKKMAGEDVGRETNYTEKEALDHLSNYVGNDFELTKVKLSEIDQDFRGLEFTDSEQSNRVISDAREKIKTGKDTSPIILNTKGEIVDGNHRAIANYLEGKDDVLAYKPKKAEPPTKQQELLTKLDEMESRNAPESERIGLVKELQKETVEGDGLFKDLDQSKTKTGKEFKAETKKLKEQYGEEAYNKAKNITNNFEDIVSRMIEKGQLKRICP